MDEGQNQPVASEAGLPAQRFPIWFPKALVAWMPAALGLAAAAGTLFDSPTAALWVLMGMVFGIVFLVAVWVAEAGEPISVLRLAAGAVGVAGLLAALLLGAHLLLEDGVDDDADADQDAAAIDSGAPLAA